MSGNGTLNDFVNKHLAASAEAGCHSGVSIFEKLVQENPLTDDEWLRLVFLVSMLITDRVQLRDSQDMQVPLEQPLAGGLGQGSEVSAEWLNGLYSMLSRSGADPKKER